MILCLTNKKKQYYITAYGLAVQQGFEGTLQEWLDSLKGDDVQLRYQDGMVQWRRIPGAGIPDGDDGSYPWQDLFDVAELQGTVVAETLETATEAAASATASAAAAAASEKAAQQSAKDAAMEAQAASIYAQEAALSAQVVGALPVTLTETDGVITADKTREQIWMAISNGIEVALKYGYFHYGLSRIRTAENILRFTAMADSDADEREIRYYFEVDKNDNWTKGEVVQIRGNFRATYGVTTLEEILEAKAAGKVIVCVNGNNPKAEVPLVTADEVGAIFSAFANGTNTVYSCYANGWTASYDAYSTTKEVGETVQKAKTDLEPLAVTLQSDASSHSASEIIEALKADRVVAVNVGSERLQITRWDESAKTVTAESAAKVNRNGRLLLTQIYTITDSKTYTLTSHNVITNKIEAKAGQAIVVDGGDPNGPTSFKGADIPNIYTAQYGTTTFTEIANAVSAGKTVECRKDYIVLPMLKFSAQAAVVTFGGTADGQSVTWKLLDGAWTESSGNEAGGGVSSWNDLTDKPFYEDGGFEWNEGNEYSEVIPVPDEAGLNCARLVKVSNDAPATDFFIGKTSVTTIKETQTGKTLTESAVLAEDSIFEVAEGLYAVAGFATFYVCTADSATVESLNFTKGIWCMDDWDSSGGAVVSALRVSGDIKQLDEKYIPDTTKPLIVSLEVNGYNASTGQAIVVADKTFAEIKAAADRHQSVSVYVPETGITVPLYQHDENMAVFALSITRGIEDITVFITYHISIASDDSVLIEESQGELATSGSGVYVGAGDMPEGYNVQIDPNGETIDPNAFILSPVTAEVGQTIIVKAVDEIGRPTEWECVDIGSGGGSGLPPVTEADNGKVLTVVDGVWTAVDMPIAEEEEF